MKSWAEIEPKDAVGIELPHPDIIGPINELGEECPWPWEPQQLKGVPLGQYHCNYCGGMQIAGTPHLDHRDDPPTPLNLRRWLLGYGDGSYHKTSPALIYLRLHHRLTGLRRGCSCSRCFNHPRRRVPAREIYEDRRRLADLERRVKELEKT